MSWYQRHVFPYLLDAACGLPVITRQRETVVPRASGRVLEVGIGTGRNLAHYDASRVTRLVGIDPGVEMHRLARRRMRRAGLAVELIGLPAETIPLPDASIDTVLITYTLCTIPDPAKALAEMRRVLAPGGRLLFCEHGRAPDAGVRRWQERLEPYWSPLAGGCHLARDIPALLRAAGFHCDALTQRYLPGPRVLTYHYWGEATASPERSG